MMLNDSVFYEPSRLEVFLKELVTTKKEVLGATQNFEINYHIGSFCISLAKSITNNKRFISYWKNFSRTDVRRAVIYRGEMELSKLLSSIVSNQSMMQVILNQHRVSQFFREGQTDKKINQWNKLLRKSKYVDWKCEHLNMLMNEFINTHNIIFHKSNESRNENNAEDRFILAQKKNIFGGEFQYIDSITQAKKILMKYGSKDLYEILGVNRQATLQQIKKAYRQMAVRYHPDKVAQLGEEYQKGAKEKFQKIQEAYENIKKQRGMK
jgi:hypothetical protein